MQWLTVLFNSAFFVNNQLAHLDFPYHVIESREQIFPISDYDVMVREYSIYK
jgi:hypothetical protein